jgi:zinc finger protein
MSAEERSSNTAATATQEGGGEETKKYEEQIYHTGEGDTLQRVIHAELGEMTELESMCPKCEENGTTRLMITDIPFFKKIIVSSFVCPHCHESNTEITFGGEYGPKRTRHHLHVKGAADMGRQIVKSEYATLKIPELELEMPRETQKGSLNTIEGLLVQTIEGLKMEQPVRRVMQPEFAQKIDDFCEKLETYRGGEKPFSVILDDPAGNSFIEPRYDYWHPTIDPQLQLFVFTRTVEERVMLGLQMEGEQQQQQGNDGDDDDDAHRADGGSHNNNNVNPDDEGWKGEPKTKADFEKRKTMHAIYNTMRTKDEEAHLDKGELAQEVIEIDEKCPACFRDSKVKMHPCDIPHFRQTIIMAFKCDSCGYKSTEIQTGGEIPTKGRKITLVALNESDLKRDVLKSNTASLIVPELELELVAGTLGGFFTTIEGLLSQVHGNLTRTPQTDFTSYGDAKVYEKAAEELKEPGRAGRMKSSMETWLDRVQTAIDGKIFPLTFILEDPLAAIYIQNPREHLPPPDNIDPQLTIEDYERTWEEDEDLGLHDMIVGTDHVQKSHEKDERDKAEREEEEKEEAEEAAEKIKQQQEEKEEKEGKQ